MSEPEAPGQCALPGRGAAAGARRTPQPRPSRTTKPGCHNGTGNGSRCRRTLSIGVRSGIRSDTSPIKGHPADEAAGCERSHRPKLGVVIACYSPVASLSTPFRCCAAKYRLHTNEPSPTLCIAAMRSLTALSAFLDVSSLNLGGASCAAFLFPSASRERRDAAHSAPLHRHGLTPPKPSDTRPTGHRGRNRISTIGPRRGQTRPGSSPREPTVRPPGSPRPETPPPRAAAATACARSRRRSRSATRRSRSPGGTGPLR